jgi:hypothetical protein
VADRPVADFDVCDRQEPVGFNGLGSMKRRFLPFAAESVSTHVRSPVIGSFYRYFRVF